MKVSRVPIAALLAFGLLLGFGLTGARADDSNPLNAPYLDNQAHRIGANSDTWFRFDYSGTPTSERPVTDITMVNGNRSRLGFEVWTRET